MAHNENKFERLSGTVERVTYHNEENGYAVLKVKVKRFRDLVTVSGNVPSISAGEHVDVQGVWFNNIKYGLEFRANFMRVAPPSSLEGIEKYLGSGLIRGIGPFFAKKLVDAFKEEVFNIIESSPQALSAIEGIGKTRAKSICKNWGEQKIVREIMVFLQSHNIGTSRATRIYKTYGEDAIKIVTEDPYRLARDIRGIGFLSADKIAKSLGIGEHSLRRARAGICYALMEALNDGHCALPYSLLLEKAEKLLDIPQDLLSEALTQEINSQYLTLDEIASEPMVFLTAYYIYEKQVAKRLLSTDKGASPSIGINYLQPKMERGVVTDIGLNLDKTIEWAERASGIKFADNQVAAIRLVLSEQVSIITGGPGTGKTTILNAVLKILASQNLKVKLCAPTGRAAKKLSENTNHESVTIHRLLEFSPQTGGFKYNSNKPLSCDALIADESSMIDIQLFNSLLKAIPLHSKIVLVGDEDQLPSVGPGQVLKDILASGSIPTVRLNQIFRQLGDSDIITNAHLVNKGMFPRLANDPGSDFRFIEADTPEEIVGKIIKLVSYIIPNKLSLDPVNDIQVLTPMQIGSCGARSLNIELQKALNPSPLSQIEKFGQIFGVGDKVMQLENNYDKEVYNGDLGFIVSIDKETSKMLIKFDARIVEYDFIDLDELSIAYAITIHKSQGSEYKAVVIPVSTQHFTMLQKKLIYTAITRGKQLVVLVGQKKAIAIALKNAKESMRYSKLKEWLELGTRIT